MTNRRRTLSALVVLTGALAFAQPLLAAPAGPSGERASVTHAEADVRPPVAFAWRIASGVWDGVTLDGLTVAAVVPGRSLAYTAESAESGAVITVDLRATALQRAALVSLARELSGGRIGDIARVRPSVVRFGAARHYVEVRAEEIGRLMSRRVAAAAEDPGR
jgi:uncharacterized protein YndB with AHSA1/START domain